ncbi:MAG: DUF4389 domain-containing protein [Actinomycetota bacterium]
MTVPSTIDPGTYLTVDSPHEVARWRPFVHWLMAIPHFIVLHAFRALAGVVFIFFWLGLLFTGRLNSGLYGLMTMYERYNARVGGFFLGYTERYAPFDFNGGPDDNGVYPPVALELPSVPETASRKSLFNVLLAIPHYLMLIVYAIAALFVAIGGWFAVVFTGRWPAGWRRFLVRVSNYYHRVWTYVAMVEPSYPKFSLPS